MQAIWSRLCIPGGLVDPIVEDKASPWLPQVLSPMLVDKQVQGHDGRRTILRMLSLFLSDLNEKLTAWMLYYM